MSAATELPSLTCSAVINRITRVFTITQQPCGPNLRADLLKRGFDGTVWMGKTAADDRKKEHGGMFFRSAKSGVFQLITLG